MFDDPVEQDKKKKWLDRTEWVDHEGPKRNSLTGNDPKYSK